MEFIVVELVYQKEEPLCKFLKPKEFFLTGKLLISTLGSPAIQIANYIVQAYKKLYA